MQKSYTEHASLKQDLTIARDALSAIRDQLPIIDEGEKTTPNQRRAMRKAILKSLAVWYSMHEHSGLKEDVIKHRTFTIQRMIGEILRMVQAPVDEDGATEEDKADDPNRKYLLDGDDK